MWRRPAPVTFLAALSALLWVVTAAVYARSCFVGDLFKWGGIAPDRPGADRQRMVSINAGVLEFYTRTFWGPEWVKGGTSPAAGVAWNFTRVMDPYEGRPVRTAWHRLGFRNDAWKHPYSTEHLVIVPLWPLLALFAAPPVWWDVRRRRAAARPAPADPPDGPEHPTPHSDR